MKVTLDEGAKVFKLLGDKTRLTIVALLAKHECCVCELVEILQMSQPSISQHIGKLKTANLIKERRQGQWIFYRLNKDAEAYPLVLSVVNHLPDQQGKIKELEQKGLRICCN
ncbi:MAG: metalloregulator ArsR/SmtB family transcription factor [Bacillus sp. (in: Bacteria)]|nr:metalloregulator ArsR/SmtB family transcription factor [Bacillus sp. (in: firmicutes)]